MFQEGEYRRIDEVSLSDVDVHRKERWFWILTLLIFFINTVIIFSEIGYFIDEALHQDLDGYNFLPLVITLFGQATLANGLFGKVHRGACLLAYFICFEALTGLMFSIFLLVILFDYQAMRKGAQKLIDEHHWHVHATTLMIWAILMTSFLAVYHFAAGYIVYSYRKIRRQRDSNF